MSVGRLTTAWVPPTTCDTTNIYKHVTNTAGGFYYKLGPANAYTGCMPPNWTNAGRYYSPGVCPSGYTEACGSVAAQTTTAVCCPTNQFTSNCITEFGPNTWTGTSITVLNSDLDVSSTIAQTKEAKGAIWASSVEVRFRVNDFTTSAPTIPTTTTTSTSSLLPPTSTSTSDPTPASNGLSAGAAAGIAIGALSFILLIAGAIGYMFWRRRKAARQIQTHEQGGGDSGAGEGAAAGAAYSLGERFTSHPGDDKKGAYSPLDRQELGGAGAGFAQLQVPMWTGTSKTSELEGSTASYTNTTSPYELPHNSETAHELPGSSPGVQR